MRIRFALGRAQHWRTLPLHHSASRYVLRRGFCGALQRYMLLLTHMTPRHWCWHFTSRASLRPQSLPGPGAHAAGLHLASPGKSTLVGCFGGTHLAPGRWAAAPPWPASLAAQAHPSPAWCRWSARRRSEPAAQPPSPDPCRGRCARSTLQATAGHSGPCGGQQSSAGPMHEGAAGRGGGERGAYVVCSPSRDNPSNSQRGVQLPATLLQRLSTQQGRCSGQSFSICLAALPLMTLKDHCVRGGTELGC